MFSSSQKERIIPIQLERTPPVTTMSSPSFDPYVGTPSPGPKNGSNGNERSIPIFKIYFIKQMVTIFISGNTPLPYKNPNKFVDQGYNELHYASPTNSQSDMARPRKPSTPTVGGARIVPIQIDGQSSPFNIKLSDPVSQSPTILQK